MSWLTASVGIGMVVCIILLFAVPVAGGVLFLALFAVTLVGIVAYHVRNATNPVGVSHTRFDFQAHSEGQRDFGQRLRDLQRLREDGLVSEEEFQKKRSEMLSEKW